MRRDANQILPVPMYHQIYLVLREQILEGRFDPDQPLPSEHQLSAHFGVSRVTLRGALERLEEDGLISRQRGRGTFALMERRGEVRRAEISGLLANLLSLGLKTTVRVVDFELVQAPGDVADALQVSPGAEVQKAVRVRSYRGEPFSHLTTFVPQEIGRHFGRKELGGKPMLALLEESGVKVSAATQWIGAKLADSVVAPLLGIELGSPLLSVTRVARDTHRQPVQLLRGLYRPDRYQYEMQLSRAKDDGTRVWVSET
ncbi:MAG: GntR family transcriptional regulator [Betaproteobacteria bacterium]|nr:GntR family transcriptional regulator [Betaproteobacteria bacterium]